MAWQEAALQTSPYTSSSESDAGEDEEGERAADTGTRDPPFHISSLLSPSSSFSSKQKRHQFFVSAGRAGGEKERTHGGDLNERACGKKQRYGADNSGKDMGAGADNCGSYGATGWDRGGICDAAAVMPPPPPPPLRPPLYPPPFLYSPPSVLHVHYQLPPSLPTFPPPPPPPPPPSPLRPRIAYTETQLRILEDIFSEKKYVSAVERRHISRQVGITEKQVKMWFQNRRTKLKKARSLLVKN